MALDNPKLRVVLDDISSGKLQLPEFQRNWKWDDERIRALLATITLGYPLGVVMTLETGGVPQFKARTLSGAEHGGGVTPAKLLLDGQQRLTSLYQALRQGAPVDTEDARGTPMKRWYYINIEAALKGVIDREEAVISLPENRVLRRDFGRQTELDLSTRQLECSEGMFPVNLAFDETEKFAWQMQYIQVHGQEALTLWPQFAQRVLNHITGFDIPMIVLPSETPQDAVCSVFERVNTGGVPLDVFELLTATYAGDRSYREEYGEDFHLGNVWTATKQELTTAHPVLGTLEGRQDSGITSSDFLQAISLVRTYERKQEGKAAAVSCKRRDLLSLPLADFRRLAPAVLEGFDWVGRFLAKQFVFHHGDLPYRTQLVPLAAVHALLSRTGGLDERSEALITRWYWCGVMGEMYGSGTESRMPRDVEQLLAAIDDPDAQEPDTIVEANFQAARIDRLASRSSAAYKGVYALLGKRGVYDWYFTEAPMTGETMVSQYVDIRQIFPKGWFAKNGGNDIRSTSIVNKMLMSYRAGSSATGAPSGYLQVLAREAGLDEVWFDDRIVSHLIDPKLLRADDFDAFYEDRRTRLLGLIEDAMGKPVAGRESRSTRAEGASVDAH
ncbi:DUF262 domain-containing protein [Kitasatospora purpeofusca]|uniref:GmrSD restriction endonuclease domain-containing protein n=1 Tax=Kitasatospora purpeofusca TaxID=67352 RepID=UPI00325192DF